MAATDQVESAGMRPPKVWLFVVMKVAMMRLAASPVARLDIAGKATHGCSGLKRSGYWANLRGSNVSKSIFLGTPGDVSNRSKIDAFGLFTGQVGYSLSSALLYVKGGAAVTRDAYEAFGTFTNGIGAGTTENRWGATVGAGLEFAFAPSWSVGVEYDHLFMGTRTMSFYSTGQVAPQLLGPAGTLVGTDRIRQDVDLATVRTNYSWGGPPLPDTDMMRM